MSAVDDIAALILHRRRILRTHLDSEVAKLEAIHGQKSCKRSFAVGRWSRSDRVRCPVEERIQIEMISFSQKQMETVQAAARSLPPEIRPDLLKLVSDQLKITDYEVQDAVDRAVRFLLDRTHRDSLPKPTPYL
jgi:hypothetical protein